MQSLIENYINGNLTTARKQAKRYSTAKLREAFIELVGYSSNKAALTAIYLKTGDCWQEACDAQ